MNDAEKFLDQIPEPYRIFGLALLPLSIGRYRRLARHGVAFVSPKATQGDVGDLLLGVIICSMSCAEFDARCQDGGVFKEEIAEWARGVMPAPWPAWFANYLPWSYSVTLMLWEVLGLGRRWRARRAPDLASRFALFKRYIAEAQKCPPVRCKQAAMRILETHWVDSLELVLREKLNWSGVEIDEEPLSKALAHYFNWADANDLIISDEDIAIAAANAKKIVEALAKSGKRESGKPGKAESPAVPGVHSMDVLAGACGAAIGGAA